MDAAQKDRLELLSQSVPTAACAAQEITELEAALALPKETEYFLSDLHGEHAAFAHLLKNACGAIRDAIACEFGDEMTEDERRAFATLVYYPAEKTPLEVAAAADTETWYATTLSRLVRLAQRFAAPYSPARVHEFIPAEFSPLIDDLLAEYGVEGRETHALALLASTIRIQRAPELIEALATTIHHMTIPHLHVIGDVYDRGPAAELIMDELLAFPSVDIQWGNHDIVWMGASLGQRGCIAHVVRNCARYGNLDILENAYGMDISTLKDFALAAYADDPCVAFGLKGNPGLSDEDLALNIKIQKAMAILQFKVEAALIDEYPCFALEDRKLLDKIDFQRNTVVVDNIEYALTDTVFPTVDPESPFALTDAEEKVMESLQNAFVNCEKLQRHIALFRDKGTLYKVCNGNLLLHACVPLNADGTLKEANIYGEICKGRRLYEVCDGYVKAAFGSDDAQLRKRGRDLMWWMWLGEASPLFAKSKMATFELYFIAEKEARKEVKNPFYSLLGDAEVLERVCTDFGLDPATAHIICGHVPVKVKDGEDPIKCGGHVLTIDGGFSSAYQKTTGIAGFTLISSADSFVLASHEPLPSTKAAIEDNIDIHSSLRTIETYEPHKLTSDTDQGAAIQTRIRELEDLLAAYRNGVIAQR